MATAAAPVDLRFVSPAGRPDLVVVEVAGVDGAALARLDGHRLERSDWLEVLAVIALPDPAADPAPLPGMLGSWAVEGDRLLFRPRFPPLPGLTLLARFDGVAFDRLAGSRDTPTVEKRWAIPALDRTPSTRVVGIWPQAESLPSNLLRFYVSFSAPMSARDVLPHVRLVDEATAVPVETAFVEVPGGLWDPQRTRLTLLVHPGRVKRGVGPGMALGPVLEEGRRYRLEVDGGALDASGLPLAEGAIHRFRVGPADRQGPDPQRWRIEPPGTQEGTLVVELAEPADHALLRRLLTVVDGTGQPVVGEVSTGVSDTRWSFRPGPGWGSGPYTLLVSPELEDPSGNRIGRSFETPPGELAVHGQPLRIELSFE